MTITHRRRMVHGMGLAATVGALASASVVLVPPERWAWEAHAQPAPTARLEIKFATYLGGTADEELREVIPDADGSLVLGGQTSSADFPVTEGAFQTRYGGEPSGTGHPGVYGGDSFVARLEPDGSALRFGTFFGGSKQERNVYGMALDSAGDILLTTMTRSDDMPTSDDAFQRRYGGGSSDWVVAKLTSDGQALKWCTYVGGSGDDTPRGGLAVDVHDRVFLVGSTSSSDFPTTSGAFQRDRKGDRDAAVVELSPDGTSVAAATLLGGSAGEGIMGVRVDDGGDLHVGGHTGSPDFPVTDRAWQRRHGGESDAFMAGLRSGLGDLMYSTFIGGVDNEWAEHRLALLPDRSVLLTGVSASEDFPTTEGVLQRDLRGANDGFLSKVWAADGAVAFSTLLGGDGTEFLLMPTVDESGRIHVVGRTSSRNFPVTFDAVQRSYGGGEGDGLYAVLSADGSALAYATYLGGSGSDLIRSIAFGARGVYLVGKTDSDDFPTTYGAFQERHSGGTDAFVVLLAGRPGRATRLWLPHTAR